MAKLSLGIPFNPFFGTVTFSGGGTITGTSGGLAFTATGTNQGFTLTPSGTGIISIGGAGIIRAIGDLRVECATSAQAIRFGSASGEVARFSSTNGYLLVGTTTDSSNGRIQLATHTTIAGGIGFGTDAAIYRSSAANLTISGTINALNSLNGSGYLRAGQFSGLAWVNVSAMKSPANGQIVLYNNAETDFSRLQFGGLTSSFPALKRVGASLSVRLADDSADADFTAGSIDALGISVDGGSEITYLNTSTSTFNFGSIASGASETLTVSVTSAPVGAQVDIDPNTATPIEAGIILDAWVSAAGTVSVRAYNATASPVDPASINLRVTVIAY